MKNNFEKVIQILNIHKKNVLPSKELLVKIISNINIDKGEEKGRLPVISSIINQIHKSMNLSWKIALPVVGIVAIIAVFLIYSQSFKEPAQYTGEKTLKEELAEKTQVSKPKEVVIPKATGNVDDVINAALAFSVNDGYVLDEEDVDASLIDADNQAIGDFGQSYGENEF